jgi:hypothetical protein
MLKMEKNWEKSTKVFGDRLVFDDGLVYLTSIPKGYLNMSPPIPKAQVTPSYGVIINW